MLWEQELFNQFKYSTPRPYFHTFDTDVSLHKFTHRECQCNKDNITNICILQQCRAGLNFASEAEANKFKSVVEDKIRNRQDKRGMHVYVHLILFIVHLVAFLYILM